MKMIMHKRKIMPLRCKRTLIEDTVEFVTVDKDPVELVTDDEDDDEDTVDADEEDIIDEDDEAIVDEEVEAVLELLEFVRNDVAYDDIV
jgi:hypothetical protein